MASRKRRRRDVRDVNVKQVHDILQASTERPLTESEMATVRKQFDDLVAAVMSRQRSTERTAKVLEGTGEGPSDPTGSSEPAGAPPKKQKRKAPGHGRNGAQALVGAKRVQVPHKTLSSGAPCPDQACRGHVYRYWRRKGDERTGGTIIRFVGQPPLDATVYELDVYRCDTCQEIYPAEPPPGVGTEKYDETAVAMVATAKYGYGIPFYRLAKMQRNLGIPLPVTTQWELVEGGAEVLHPIFEEMRRQAAQGKVVHGDDTRARILDFVRDPDDERTGLHTTGVVSVVGEGEEQRRIALFMTGRQHAGENLGDVLGQREEGQEPPILMADAQSCNVPHGVELLLANCLAHGRRNFVDVAESFPEECRHVLEELGEVYAVDELARQRGLSPQQRLELHQVHSKPVMDRLHAWMTAQLEERRTEPNSGLGKAMRYLLKRWEPLTLFLRVAGAPLDNNAVERALKKAVLNRKNSLFYRTSKGAQVGDLYMSLIYTCELNGENPFGYLTELLRHADELAADPAAWMPWTYRTQLTRAGPE